ncbi:MAG: response regulator, partial [Magnetovibrio sp.]|nr:response regulator [Magnetovibrio sp.]
SADGEAGWEIIQRQSIDLAIIDWYMKPMDGIQLTKLIRNDKACPNPYLPVIMISGFAERARIFGARDSGINEFVVKPLSAKALFGRIQNVIEHPRQFVRTETFFGPDRRRKDQDVKEDRRGTGVTEKAPEKDMKADMNQEEVDAFLNPDSVPAENE